MTTTNIDLYRSVRKENFPDGVIVDNHAVEGVLHPSFEQSTYQVVQKGRTVTRTRPADVNPYPYKGKSVIDPGGGTSLFDKDGAFGQRHWWYFHIPAETNVPASLKIRHTGYNDTYQADHYQIEAASHRMPIDSYKSALDNLARNAIAKLYEDAH